MTPSEELALELAGEIDGDAMYLLPLILSRTDVAKMEAALEGRPALAIRALARSGMRAPELAHFALRDDGSLALPDRQVCLDEETFRALPGPFPESQDEVERWVLAAAERAGVMARYQATGRKPSAAMLRHAFAAHMLEDGLDLVTLHHLMGHANFFTTHLCLRWAVRLRSSYFQYHPLMDHPELPFGPNLPVSLVAAEGEDRPYARLSEEEVLDLLRAAANLHEMRVLRTLYATGARKRELVNFRIADLEREERRLFVREGKLGNDRFVLVDPGTIGLLDSGPLSDSLCDATWQGTYNVVHRAALRSGLHAKYHALGLTVSPHAIRHAFASHLYQRGMPLGDVQALLGHRDLITTRIYVDCPLATQAEQYALTHPLARSDGS